MYYYDDWARQIVAGDWLSQAVTIPSHRWHREVARIYRATHSIASLGPEDSPAEERQNAAQWGTWMHLPAFYQDPLYSYIVAATYRVAGSTARYVFILQLFTGVVSVLLIWGITRRVFDDLVAAIAGLLALFCAPLLFYEVLLLRDSLLVCSLLLITWLLLLRTTRETRAGGCLLGLAIGVGSLLKSTLLVFGVATLTGMLVSRWHRRQIAMTAIGVAIGLAPGVVRNVAIGLSPLTLATSGPLTLLCANEANYPPDAGFAVQPALVAHFLGDTRGTWRDALSLAADSHTVSSYLEQVWGKWRSAWHWFEIPNNENYYYARRTAPVLMWLPVTMLILSPLGLVGLWLAASCMRQRWPLFAAVASAMIPLLVFYVVGRFRVALLATVIPFAAFTLAQTVRFLSVRRYAAACLCIGSVVAIATWSGQPLGPHQVLVRTADWIVPFSALYEAPIEAAARSRRFRTAAQLYAEYFRLYEPDPVIVRENSGLRSELAAMHRQCAELFDAAGDGIDAAAQRAAAEALDRGR